MQTNQSLYEEKNFKTAGQRYAIVVARFNSYLTEPMLNEAIRGFKEYGVEDKSLKIVYVPGAFELPLVAKKMAESSRYDAVVCIGAVVRGETAHFDFVAGEAAAGIMRTSLETGLPIIFSVSTTDTVEQAKERIKNGYEGALCALEMVATLKMI